jgi:hypothetical protein
MQNSLGELPEAGVSNLARRLHIQKMGRKDPLSLKEEHYEIQ